MLKTTFRHLVQGFLLICLLLLIAAPCFAQAPADTTIPKSNQPLFPTRNNKPDTAFITNADTSHVTAKAGPFQPNAKRAGLYSAILPGLGQFYNRQYWKVPVIYAGLAVAGYFINDNLTNYRAYRKAYIGRINNPYPTDKYVRVYTVDQLQQLQDQYSKFLNMSVLFTGIGYTLQIVEAMTGAHLKNFDISRDISLHMQPVIYPNAVGMGLVVNF